MLTLERNIRRKWSKSFPDVELFLRLVKDKYEHFNPLIFDDNSENCFENLQRWKLEVQEFHLPRNVKPRRHKKILGPLNRPLIRGWFFFIF